MRRKAPQPASTHDQAIAKLREGPMDVTPGEAIELAGALYSRGELAEAERVCRQIIAARPANGDAHNILGVVLAALGQVDEAVAALDRAIELNAGAASYRANLAEVLRQAGRLEAASAVIAEAIKLDPENAQALNNLGIIQYEQRRFNDAAESYRRALALQPTMAEALNNLGNALRLTGEPAEALDCYRRALAARPTYPEAHNNLGTLLQQQGIWEEAERALRTAIEQNPRYLEAHCNLALLLSSQRREEEALKIIAEALAFASDKVQPLLVTARIQLQRGNLDVAEQAVDIVLAQEPDNAAALTLLGQILHDGDRFAEAVDVLHRAVLLEPQNPEALNHYGVALKSVGRLEEAREHITRAVGLNGSLYGAYANLSDLVDFSDNSTDDLFDRMEAIVHAAPDAEAPPLLPLHYAFAKALDDRGDHETALAHYITGGRMKRAELDDDETEMHAFFDSIRAAFPERMFTSRGYAGLTDRRPVFIVGMPRSGSTLVEQILSSHPDVHGSGEIKHLSRAITRLRDRFPELPKYPTIMESITPDQLDGMARDYLQAISAEASGAKRITDKLLTNYFSLGLINLMFPNAKVIHTRRHPIDTCLSAFTKLFKDDLPHSYDLAELGRYYRKYRELMDHWEKVLPEGFMTSVDYEDVVADSEREARRLVDFIGLQWDERCIDFHKSARPVKTASLAQVRRPIYTSSIQRWKKYGKGLQPLIDAIERPDE